MRHHQAEPSDPPILTRAVVIPPACERSNIVPWLAALIAAGVAALAGIGWIDAKIDAARDVHAMEIRMAKIAEDALDRYGVPSCTLVFEPASIDR